MTKRELYIEKIKPFIDKDIIKVLTGIRRSGKSVMLKLIMEELKQNGIDEKQFININFENLINKELTASDKLHKYILKKASEIKKKCYIFLDEIQEVKEQEKCINSLRVNEKYNFDIYITGSNAKLLSGELSIYLAGRYVEFVIYPFSFKEFLDTLKSIQQSISIREAFQKYIKFGGMPFLYNLAFEEEPSLQYLNDIYLSIILKDITQRNKIRDIDLLERVINYLTISSKKSPTSISRG